MCSRGIWQLKKMQIFFCDWSGSSLGTRIFLQSPLLPQFQNTNKHIQFEIYLKRNGHPFITALYINGYVKDVPLRNRNQEEILQLCNQVNRSFGVRKNKKGNNVLNPNRRDSIQGKYQIGMFQYKPFYQLQRISKVEYPNIPSKRVLINQQMLQRDPHKLVMSTKLKRSPYYQRFQQVY